MMHRFLVGATFWALACSPSDDRITVFAAASLVDAFDALADTARTLVPPLGVRVNYAGSQELARQLEFGARADIFASADERWMDHVASRGLLGDHVPVIFAHNVVTVVVPATNPANIVSPTDLARDDVKIVMAGPAVPAGAYARETVRRLADRTDRPEEFLAAVMKNVVSDEPNVRAVLAKVELAEVDAGFVYASDAIAGGDRVRLLPLPPSVAVRLSYPAALLDQGRDDARRFVALLLSDTGRRIFESLGFTAPLRKGS